MMNGTPEEMWGPSQLRLAARGALRARPPLPAIVSRAAMEAETCAPVVGGGRSEGRPPPPVLRHWFHPAVWRAIEETAARGADVAELASERTAAWARDAAAVDLGDASTFAHPHPRDDEDASDAALRRALLVEARATLDSSVRTADDDDPSPLARFALRQGPDTAAALDALESARAERAEEVERVCAEHYEDFTRAMAELDGIRDGILRLGRDAASHRASLRDAGEPLLRRIDAVRECAATETRVERAISAVTACQAALETAAEARDALRRGDLVACLSRVDRLERHVAPACPSRTLAAHLARQCAPAREAVARAADAAARDWLTAARGAAREMGSNEMARAGRGWAAADARRAARRRRRRAERDARSGDVEVVREMVRESVRRARERAKPQPRAKNGAAAAAANATSSSSGATATATATATAAAADSDETRIRRRIDFTAEIVEMREDDRRRRDDESDTVGDAADPSSAKGTANGTASGPGSGSSSSLGSGSVADLDLAPILRCRRVFDAMGVGDRFEAHLGRERALQLAADVRTPPNAAPDDALRKLVNDGLAAFVGHFAAQERLARAFGRFDARSDGEEDVSDGNGRGPGRGPGRGRDDRGDDDRSAPSAPASASAPSSASSSYAAAYAEARDSLASTLVRLCRASRDPGVLLATRDATRVAAAALRLRGYDATALDAAATTASASHLDALADATRDAAADGFAPERLVPSLDGGPSSRFAEDIANAAAAFAVEAGARVGGDRGRAEGDARRATSDAARDAAAKTRACVEATADALEKTLVGGFGGDGDETRGGGGGARAMKEWHLAQLVGDAARLNAEAAAWERAAAATAARVVVAGGDEDAAETETEDEESETAFARDVSSSGDVSSPGVPSAARGRRARLASALRFPLPTNVAATATTRDWTPFASFARAAESALIDLVIGRVEGLLAAASSSDPAEDFAPTNAAGGVRPDEPSEAIASTLTYLDGTLRLASATLPAESARRLAEASVGAAARGLVDAARSPAVRKVTERGVARMRADLDALETFAASLAHATARASRGTMAGMGSEPAAGSEPAVGSWAWNALAAPRMLVGLLTGDGADAEEAARAAARDAAAAGTSAEALAKILDKYRETGGAEGMVFPPKRRVEAAARVLRGKA